MPTDFSTGYWLLDWILNNPLPALLLYVLVNVLLYGFAGLFNGYWPVKVNLHFDGEDHCFYTWRSEVYNVECLTRIVQWRYFPHSTRISNEARAAILNKYGPSKQRRPRHYKLIKMSR